MTSGHKVLHRRTLATVSHGSNEDEYSHLHRPIRWEEDEREHLGDDNLDGSEDEFSQEEEKRSDNNLDGSEDEFSQEEEEEHSDNNQHNDEVEVSPEEDGGDDECSYPAAWENDFHMACNNMHEMDMIRTDDSLSFITCGGDRCVFRVTDIDGNIFVLKTLK